MRTRLNEIAERTIFKYSDEIYCGMKAQLDHAYSYPTSYNVRSLPMASRIDISSQIRNEVYRPLTNAFHNET